MSFWKNRRVFVTGCTGFLGYWITQDLLRSQARVVGLVRDLVPQSPFFLHGVVDDITVIRGSIEDSVVIDRLLNEYEIDTVIHLAAQAIVGVANRNPVATFETNIRGTWTLLEACRRSELVTRVVVASSDKAYGIHDKLPYDEGCALQGSHPYDVSKSCADLIARTYYHTYDLPVCVTRCGNLFGPGDLNFSRLVPGTINTMLHNQRPVIRSDGSPIRDYVNVKDIAGAYLHLAESMNDSAIHGRAFNFGTGEPLSVLELTQTILRAGGREDLEPHVLSQDHGEIHHQYLSSELARETLGWQPGATVEERLEESIDWYRDYFKKVESGESN